MRTCSDAGVLKLLHILLFMAPDIDLAARRTLLANDRTLMAWIRTSTSLISFGFTVYKFFEFVNEKPTFPRRDTFIGPREFAIGMIGLGVASLAIAAVHYRQTRVILEKIDGGEFRSLAGHLAVVVSVFGLLLLIVVLFRK